jgi:hypothetical protein
VNILLAILCAVLYIGDSLTNAEPGYTMKYADRAIVYFLADAEAHLKDVGHYQRIVVELGIHAVRHRGPDRQYRDNPDLFRRDYAAVLDMAQRHSSEVVVINIPWLNWGPLRAQQAQAFNAIIAEEASKRSIYVVDAWSLFGECGMDCIGKDGFHPSQAGYDLLRHAIPPLPPLRCRPIGWVERNQ